MSITVLSDLFMPRLVIEAGVKGKQIRRNARVTTVGGEESINAVWARTLREYEVGFVPMTRLQWQAMEALHDITKGGAYGFLMEDPKDSSVVNTDRMAGVVAQLTSTTFRTYKRTTDPASGRYSDRKITRPRSTISVFVNGSPATFTVDTDTGIITIPAAPDPSTVTWSGQFYVPVHFLDDSLSWEIAAPSQDPNARYIAGPPAVLQEIAE